MSGLKSVALLMLPNVFMTFVWHGHLRDLKEKVTWNYAGAALSLAGTVFFIFRK